MKDILQPLFNQFMPFAQKRMGFQKPPRVFLRDDPENAQNPLGKTAYYDPEKMSVTLYINGRHPKDVMRSLSHELVHHTQNCNGQFDDIDEMGEGYAQNDAHLREMERQAYEKGNLCFRDWEDSIKGTIYIQNLNVDIQKEGKLNMSTKDWKNRELPTLLTEKWGFSFNLLTESQEEETVEEGFTGPTGDPKDLPRSVASTTAAAKEKREEEKYINQLKAHYGSEWRKYYSPRKEQKLEEETDERFMPPECRRGGAQEGSQKCIDAARMAQGLYAESEEIEEGASSSGRELTADREQNDDRRSSQKRARPMEEGEEPENKDKADLDKDGKLSSYEKKRGSAIEKSMKDKKEKMDEAQIRQLIRKLVKEAMNKKESR